MKKGVKGVVVGIAVSASVCGMAASGLPARGALGVHEHGVADLTVAVEGQTVDLMLSAPSGDLVGFERAPISEQELVSIRERVAALEAGDWFIWEGGRCEQVSVEVTLPAALTPSDTGGDHHGQNFGHPDHVRHHKQQDHKHRGHEHHDHERHDDHDHDQGHMDGMVNWQYRCEPGVRLRRVEVRLFELLPLERIRAEVISERGQGAGSLTARARQLSLP